jgi:hypothetical protein
MDYVLTNEYRVLALDPSHRGLGFVVLEGPDRLIDWGVRQAAGDTDAEKNTACVAIARQLIDQYRPHALAIEDCAGDDSRRRPRARELLEAIRKMAREKRVKVMDFSPERVRRAFAPKKDVIAAAIAGRFPELASRLPKARTLTMSAQYGMPVFDAMAFALTLFHFRNRRNAAEQRRALASAFGALK